MAKEAKTVTSKQLVKFKLWSSQLKAGGTVLINPRAVSSVRQEGHHPPACTIFMRSGEQYLVSAEFVEVEDAMNEAGSSNVGERS